MKPFNCSFQGAGALAFTLVVASLFVSEAPGGKGGKGGGKGGGGDAVYEVVQLPGPNGASSVAEVVAATSADGSTSVIGRFDGGNVPHGNGAPCLWRVDALGNVPQTTDLSPGLHWANDVNSAGMIGGAANEQARILLSDLSVVDLPTLGGLEGEVVAMNEPNELGVAQVVGWSETVTGNGHSVLWEVDVDGNVYKTVDLTLALAEPFGDFSPTDINNQGVMAGLAYDSILGVLPAVAFLDASGILQVTPLPHVDPVNDPETRAIDDSLNVVGRGCGVPGSEPGICLATHGIYWSSDDGSGLNLSLATGVDTTYAEDIATIDQSVQIVGKAQNGTNPQYAFLWLGGLIFDLNDIAPAGQTDLRHANSINASGLIVGFGDFGSRRNRVEHGFLLLPIGP